MSANPSPFYIPETFSGRRIKFRVPYTMPGELIVNAETTGIDYPEGTFLHSVELPFEVWEMSMTGSLLEEGQPFIPPVAGIDKFWRLSVRDLSKNQQITKSASLVSNLKDSNTDTWYWRVPYTLVRAEGFQVTVDNLLSENQLRSEVSFRGYLLVLEPASENR